MCISPILIQNKFNDLGTGRFTPVPCSKCPECKKAKFNSWLFRISKEQQRSENPLFITLTYADEHLPMVGAYVPTLVKRDLQLFFKKLRKAHSKTSTSKLKYYAVGEYGSKTARPHYHLILFNLLDSNLVNPAWGMGFDYTKPVEGGAITYVLKYIQKPSEWDKRDIRQREFSLMSKGIGTNYLTDNMVQYHHRDVANCFVTLPGNIKLPMPKYFKEKIYSEEMRKKVTDYLKIRALRHENDVIRTVALQNSQMSPNEVLNYIEMSKYNTKFEKRIREVL